MNYKPTNIKIIIPLPLTINGNDNILLSNIIRNTSSFAINASQNFITLENEQMINILNNLSQHLPQQTINIITDSNIKINQYLSEIDSLNKNKQFDMVKYLEYEAYKQLIKINSILASYLIKTYMLSQQNNDINQQNNDINQQNNDINQQFTQHVIKLNSKAQSLLNSELLINEALNTFNLGDKEKADILINEALKELIKVDIIIKYDDLISKSSATTDNKLQQELLVEAQKQNFKLASLNKLNQLKESALRAKNENNITLATDLLNTANQEEIKFKSLIKSEIYKNEASNDINDGNIEDATKKTEKSNKYDIKYNTITTAQTYVDEINKSLEKGEVEEAKKYKNVLQSLTVKQPESNNIENDNYVYVDNSNLDSESDNLYNIVFNTTNEEDNLNIKSFNNEELKQYNDVIAYSGSDYASLN